MLQPLIHYSLHFLFPGALAFALFRERWKLVWLMLFTTMLVDLDHLVADPIFDPNRCSIGFHPLHSEIAIAFYLVLLLVPNFYVRAISVGLLFHMLTDWLDCLWL